MSSINVEISGKSSPKSPAKIDQADFKRLRTLFTNIEWLVDTEKEFFELWNSCNNSHQQDLVEELLPRFSYITSRDLKKYGEQIADCILHTWKLDPSKSLIVAFAESDKPDGSQVLLQSLKNKFDFSSGWSENNFVNKISAGANRLKDGHTAVLIDDFVGTGKTAFRRVKYMKKVLKKRNIFNFKIYMASLATMELAQSKISSLNFNDYYSCIWLKRGISDEYCGEELNLRTNSMTELENLLAASINNRKLSDVNFGFKKSEALYVMESYNIPNNVFPVFWWAKFASGKSRNPMFKRV